MEKVIRSLRRLVRSLHLRTKCRNCGFDEEGNTTLPEKRSRKRVDNKDWRLEKNDKKFNSPFQVSMSNPNQLSKEP
jgi:hypothetical protein